MNIDVTVTVSVPYDLRLPLNHYGRLDLMLGSVQGQTGFVMRFPADDNWPEQRQLDEQEAQASRMLHELNRLLRWYRYLSRDAAVVELTLANAGPFVFTTGDGDARWGPSHGEFYVSSAPVSQSESRPSAEIGRIVSRQLIAEVEPPVWHLLVLDAEVARAEARFREAVLLSWSAIESCFSTTYEQLIDRQSGDLSSDERKSLKGRDTSLVSRMTAGPKLAADQSLHELLGEDWPKRRASYRARNAVVHEGADANDGEAEQSIEFARLVIKAMEALPAEPSVGLS